MMKKSFKKVSLILALAFLLSVFSVFSVGAASYPLIFFNSYGLQIIEGTVGELEFTIFPEYKNEEYHIDVYDDSGMKIASASSTYYNYNVITRDLSITVDTADLGMKPGKYTVEYYLSFYSFMEWHDAPNSYSATFYVIDDICNGNHKFGDVSVVTESTCATAGKGKKTCSVCTYTENVDLPLGEHIWDEGTVTKEATCTFEGTFTYTCTECGETKSETIAKGKHVYGDCVSISESEHLSCCVYCGKEKVEKHNFSMGKIITSPTYTTEGTAEYVCKNCEYSYIGTVSRVIRGDVDADGEITANDYISSKRLHFGTLKLNNLPDADNAAYRADVDNNSKIDATDYVLLKRAFFGTYKIAD